MVIFLDALRFKNIERFLCVDLTVYVYGEA